jgi:ribonuclease HI
MSNNGLCGIAWKAIYKDGSSRINAKHIGKNDSNTAELIAIYDALTIIEVNSDIILYTDSKYCLDILENIALKKKKEFKNMNILTSILSRIKLMNSFSSKHVKSHSNNKHNNQIDKYAKMAAKNINLNYNIIIPTVNGNYNYTKEEIMLFINDYLKTLSETQLANVISHMVCAQFSWQEKKKKFNGSVELIMGEKKETYNNE